jgi:peptidoglycan/xylan/chitin deacetylase (PgdA/CDA1 family)
MGEKILLIRYDTESDRVDSMEGFFEKAIEVHRRDGIPATFFCRGAAIDAREEQFRAFYEEVKDDPLFDIQDHSYSHIGVGYAEGKPVDVLREDYERSFAAHERVFGVRPVGVSICGTAGKDGPRLAGFDETEKAKEELSMLASLGVKMINSHLAGRDEHREFVNYGSIGHPDMMGFPSGYSDTGWMYDWRSDTHPEDPVGYMLGVMNEHAERGDHMPIMLHDWLAWTHAPDTDLSHVSTFAEKGRELGYRPATHVECLNDESLWRD